MSGYQPQKRIPGIRLLGGKAIFRYALRDDSQPVTLGIYHNLTVMENLMILIRGLLCLQEQGLILFNT